MENFEDAVKSVADSLATLLYRVKINNAGGLYNINSLAEDLLIPLLKLLFDCPDLRSTNTKKRNYPAIDLYDEKARFAFQITSKNTGSKVKKTLQEFVDNKFHEKYDRLIVLIIGDKQGSYTFTNPDNFPNESDFKFDREGDIWDIEGLSNEVRNLGVENLDKIRQISQLLREGLEKKLRAEQPILKRYVPISQYPLYIQNRQQLENLGKLLFSKEGDDVSQNVRGSVKLGLVGMGGIGKTQLAVCLAYNYWDSPEFSDGIFWMSAAGTSSDWIRNLAGLAWGTTNLPSDDDPNHPDNELKRAQHVCRYLANSTKVLLILDNVDKIASVLTTLISLAGKELSCKVVYTSKSVTAPSGIITYSVEKLTFDSAIELLLKDTRPAILDEIQKNVQNAETEAAKNLCNLVDFLPLALVHLRALLKIDEALPLSELHNVVLEHSALSIIDETDEFSAPLRATFQLSWEKVTNESAKDLFMLACYFPEALPVPLWLLGIVTGLGQQSDAYTPLGKAKNHLIELSLIEKFDARQVRLHPLVREFGLELVKIRPEVAHLKKTASDKLASAFEDISFLEELTRENDYWNTLETIRDITRYIRALEIEENTQRLLFIERQFDKESYSLGNGVLWPNKLPNFFHQQFYNRLIEEGKLFAKSVTSEKGTWLRQVNRVGFEDPALLRVLMGHNADIRLVTFTKNNERIISLSKDKTLAIWDANSGKLLRSFAGEIVGFSSNGSQLAIADNTDILLFDLALGQAPKILEGHEEQVTLLKFTSNDSKIISVSKDNNIRIWDTKSCNELANLVGGGIEADCIVIDSCDSKFVINSKDGIFTLGDLEKADIIYIQDSGFNVSTLLSFSPDSLLLAVANRNNKDHFISIYKIDVQREILKLEGHTGNITAVKFSPNGKLLASTSGDRTAKLWEVNSGRELYSLKHSDWIDDFAFSPDGSKLAVANMDNKIYLWETSTGNFRGWFTGHTSGVRSISFSSDGLKLVSSSEDKTIRIWECSKVRNIASSDLDTSTKDLVRCAAFLPDGNTFMTGSLDGNVYLWETLSGSFKQALRKFDEGVHQILLSPDATQIAFSFDKQSPQIWDINFERCLVTLEGAEDYCTSLKYSLDGSIIIGSFLQTGIFLWDSSSGKLITAMAYDYYMVNNLAVSSKSDIDIRLSMGTTKIISIPHSMPHADFRLMSFPMPLNNTWQEIEGEDRLFPATIEGIEFSPDGQFILVGFYDGRICICESKYLDIVAEFPHGHTGRVNLSKFSPDGQFVVTCAFNGELRLWKMLDTKQGELLAAYNADSPIEGLYWNNGQLYIITRGYNKLRPYVYNLSIEGLQTG